MICPNCMNPTLRKEVLDADLEAYKCETCSGSWIPSRNYMRFIESHKIDLSALDPKTLTKVFSDKDSENKKRCPDCGKLVEAAKAGFGADFQVERCEHCFGIWLDENEWDLLKKQNLEAAIYYMFSSSWKSKVRTQGEFDRKIETIQKNFDDNQKDKITDFIIWLEKQENKDLIKSYILA